MPDSQAKTACTQVVAWFEEAMAAGKVFRGGWNTGMPPMRGSTLGQYDAADSSFHIDPFFLDSATTPGRVKYIARTLLHDAAHAYGGVQHSGYQPPAGDDDYEGYATYSYFKFIHSTKTSDACIDPLF